MNWKKEEPLIETEGLSKQPTFSRPNLVTQQSRSPSSFNSFLQGNYTQNFVEAMSQAGVPFKENIIEDGTIHRFSTENKSQKDGWYVFYGLAGAFGDWRQGLSKTWSLKHQDWIRNSSLSKLKRLKKLQKRKQTKNLSWTKKSVWMPRMGRRKHPGITAPPSRAQTITKPIRRMTSRRIRLRKRMKSRRPRKADFLLRMKKRALSVAWGWALRRWPR